MKFRLLKYKLKLTDWFLKYLWLPYLLAVKSQNFIIRILLLVTLFLHFEPSKLFFKYHVFISTFVFYLNKIVITVGYVAINFHHVGILGVLYCFKHQKNLHASYNFQYHFVFQRQRDRGFSNTVYFYQFCSTYVTFEFFILFLI